MLTTESVIGAMRRHDGIIKRAASELGCHRATLGRFLRRNGLESLRSELRAQARKRKREQKLSKLRSELHEAQSLVGKHDGRVRRGLKRFASLSYSQVQQLERDQRAALVAQRKAAQLERKVAHV